jgi:Tfp pilus assembly protein PilZ
MDDRFDVPRTIRRMAPKHAATAAVFKDAQQLAYGVVTNVSVTGACIVTDSPLAPGSDVDLKLSFYQQPDLYEIGARVVWNRRGGAREKGFEGLQLHGVQFTLTSAMQRSRLHELLDNGGFDDVYRPSATEFDVLQSALASELDELGSKIHKTTGEKS